MEAIRQNQIGKRNSLWGCLVAVLCMIILLLLTFLVLLVVRYLEQTKLFQPTVLKRTSMSQPEQYFPGTTWYDLPHGGGLLHYTPDRNGDLTRRVFFMHGNSYELKQYIPALDTLKTLGYDVWAVEYAGFGLTAPRRTMNPLSGPVPNAKSVLQDVYDAWKICGDKNTIVIGFSIGGAILGETYDHLSPEPAQLVFLNTFASFPNLVQEKMGALGKLLSPLLETRWHTKPPKNFHGKVTVVYTRDDVVVPPEQGRQICRIFKENDPKCIELDSGGHRYSALNHREKWANSENLLPAQLV